MQSKPPQEATKVDKLPFIFCDKHRLQFKSIRGGMLHLAKHPDHRAEVKG